MEKDIKSEKKGPKIVLNKRGEMVLPGKYFIFITSVIFFVIGMVGLMGINEKYALIDKIAKGTADLKLLEEMGIPPEAYPTIFCANILISSIMTICGIVGLLWSNIPRRSKVVFIAGIILVAGQLISLCIQGSVGILHVAPAIFSMVLPLLYLYGAYRNYCLVKKL